MWYAEYNSPLSSVEPTTSSTDPHVVPLHSTPLRSLMTSSLRVESDSRQQELSLVDRYKSETNIYQLSYCDDSDEETEVVKKKVEAQRPPSEMKLVESPIELEPKKLERSLVDVISQFLAEIDDKPASDAIGLFTNILDECFPPGEDGNTGPNLPYPPVSQFALHLLDYRLGKDCTLLNLEVPEPSPRDGPLTPVRNLVETDYDFESLYGNELPELPYRPTFETSSSLSHPSSNLGDFLNCILNRVESMHKNCLYFNLLLTDIVMILASFHQYPLADVLLRSADIRLKAPSQSLYQVGVSNIINL